ncbi:hypothetical protein Tco_1512843, partial [Tanacetum coccineum]
SFEDGVLRNSYGLKLGDLLIANINNDGDSIWSNIKNLQKRITLASVKDYSSKLDIPLPVWIMCGLLKSKNNLIRWGFLFVLERLLMRCKFLLDESELQHSVGNEDHKKTRLDKANVVMDIMSSALSLVAQINMTNHMNILKVNLLLIIDALCFLLDLWALPYNFTESHIYFNSFGNLNSASELTYVIIMRFQPTWLTQLATKGNLGEVSLERSQVRASP